MVLWICVEAVIKVPASSTPSALSTTLKSVSVTSKSVSASLPGLLKGPATPHVGRPSTVMTPEQIVEKARQVCCLQNFFFTKYCNWDHVLGSPCDVENCWTATRGFVDREEVTQSYWTCESQNALGLSVGGNGLACCRFHSREEMEKSCR